MTTIRPRNIARLCLAGLLGVLLNGCAAVADRSPVPSSVQVPAELTPVTGSYYDLVNLPPPRGQVLASVYGFRDQSGQFRKQPNSNFSTAVTQGAASMLVRAYDPCISCSVH